MNAPFDSEVITDQFTDLESAVMTDLHDEGFTDDDIQTQRYADMRYQAQVHQLSIPVPSGTLTADDMEAVIARFERTYEDRYGKGAGTASPVSSW